MRGVRRRRAVRRVKMRVSFSVEVPTEDSDEAYRIVTSEQVPLVDAPGWVFEVAEPWDYVERLAIHHRKAHDREIGALREALAIVSQCCGCIFKDSDGLYRAQRDDKVIESINQVVGPL